MKLHVIVTVFNRWKPLRILMECFIQQTNENWRMQIANDGPAIQQIRDIMCLHRDDRITLYEHPKTLGSWGFPLRRFMLEQLQGEPTDFVLITNDDNYYVPLYVEYMLKECSSDVGIVYCDTIHSHQSYNILNCDLKVSSIDMGSLIVRLDVAKEIGIKHDVYYADGLYAEECAMRCAEKRLRAIKISKPLYIHN